MIDEFFDRVGYRLDHALDSRHSVQMIKEAIGYYRFVRKEIAIDAVAFKLNWDWIFK